VMPNNHPHPSPRAILPAAFFILAVFPSGAHRSGDCERRRDGRRADPRPGRDASDTPSYTSCTIHNHKVDKNQVPLAKYLFLTRNMAQAMRFDSMSEAQKILRGVNVKWASGKLNNKNGFTEKQIRSLTVSRLFVETVNSSGNITKLSNTKKD
jgi:hypothetical protein